MRTITDHFERFSHKCQIKKNPPEFVSGGSLYGAPSRIRIHNLLIRSQTPYPIWPWAHVLGNSNAENKNCQTNIQSRDRTNKSTLFASKHTDDLTQNQRIKLPIVKVECQPFSSEQQQTRNSQDAVTNAQPPRVCFILLVISDGTSATKHCNGHKRRHRHDLLFRCHIRLRQAKFIRNRLLNNLVHRYGNKFGKVGILGESRQQGR